MVNIYHVTIRGALPHEIARRIAAVHAFAILLRSGPGECNIPVSPAIVVRSGPSPVQFPVHRSVQRR